MSVFAPHADFVYGNTRLRARKAELLAAADYDALLAGDVEAVQALLGETAYRRDLEAAQAVHSGKPALHDALRRHLGRVLAELRSFYQDRSRELVDLLLARYDLHNLLAVLRGQVRAQPAERTRLAVIPFGRLGGPAGEEIAAQREAAAAVELLVGWRLPDSATARVLARAWPEFERTQDLAALEHALAAVHALSIDRSLSEAGPDADPLRELLARERDAANVLAVLRVREALELGELADSPALASLRLAGGDIGPETLETALREPRREDATAVLAAAAGRVDWRISLERYGSGRGDLPALRRELEQARVRWALSLFLRGDPLGLGVPIAYTVAKENEARNLRLIAENADAGGDETLRGQLVLADGGGRWGS
jgi:vacuolar-type H+-ATPase subunit C/Vma6